MTHSEYIVNRVREFFIIQSTILHAIKSMSLLNNITYNYYTYYHMIKSIKKLLYIFIIIYLSCTLINCHYIIIKIKLCMFRKIFSVNLFGKVSLIDCLFMKFHGMRIPIKINTVFPQIVCCRLFIVTYLKHVT